MRLRPVGVFGAIVVTVFAVPLAHANIYTWVDAKGVVNVSNVAPPEGVRILRNTPDPPPDPARDAAREFARLAELQALQHQVAQLQQDLDQTRREAAAVASTPPVIVVYPPAPAPQYAGMAANDSGGYAQPVSACDYSFNCGFWGWPGVYSSIVVANVPAVRYPRQHRFAPVRDPRPINLRPLVPMAQARAVGSAPRR